MESQIRALCNMAAGSFGWSVRDVPVRGFAWKLLLPSEISLPETGRKIHVSLTERGLELALKAFLEHFLSMPKTCFKLPSNRFGLAMLNSGRAGKTQIGKVLTFYPKDESQFDSLIEWLIRVIPQFDGPEVPGERLCRAGTTIFERFGGFRTYFIEDERGLPIRYRRNPTTGSLEEDIYPRIPVQSEIEPTLHSKSGQSYQIGRQISHFPTQVFQALKLDTFEPVVLKRTGSDAFSGHDGSAIQSLRQEAAVLSDLVGQPWACQLVESWHTSAHYNLVLQKAEGITLSRATDRSLSRFGLSLAQALNHLHKMGYVHGDLKLDNVLGYEGKVTLIDFGNCRPAGETRVPLRTPGYSAPELRVRGKNDVAEFNQDIYAFGCCLFHLATGTNPSFVAEGMCRVQRLLNILDIPTPWRDLMTACLAVNPADRPTATECLSFIQARVL